MRFDIISIFPQFFAALELSLVGKAQDAGVVDVRVHNLRDWATGRHLSVDDSPTGGGAGMVMRPDVWGQAIDEVLRSGDSPSPILAIPTPSGSPLTQRDLEYLATKSHIIVACGRYEGIDARVGKHYVDAGVEVFEYSLGDYVLNGGEVAAVALVEGVSRLIEGVVGNPQSLAEESHSAEGLLEYPVYTQPRVWRGEEVPAVLFSGDHGRIRRWRRSEALSRTASRRSDMIAALLAKGSPMDGEDREVLASRGVNPVDGLQSFVFGFATRQDLPEVSALAQETFRLACPPNTAEEEIEEFTTNSLNLSTFETYLDEGARIGTVHFGKGGPLIAYSLLQEHVPTELEQYAEGAVYVSKLYSAAQWHGSGIGGALLEFALKDAVTRWGGVFALLGTNKSNKRAIRFYRRHGFVKVGRRIFNVGGRDHNDFVFVRDLTEDPPRYWDLPLDLA